MSQTANLLQMAKRVAKVALGRDLFVRLQLRCSTRQFGSGYGAWTICPDGLGHDSVVYSFGVGTDVAFDLGLIAAYGLKVHAFDPTPQSISWFKNQQFPPALHLHEYGIADTDGAIDLYPPNNPSYVSHSAVERAGVEPIQASVRRLSTIMNELGHQQIDLLKMDIEGAEYAVVEDIVTSGIPIRQLLIEFHHRFPQVGPVATRRAVATLAAHGFRLFAVSSSGEEYSFLHVTHPSAQHA
ncbi:MAG: FkbM family methyltransferase [Oscillochloris sp.]|nr:FkbM family methyltransferase [Oscillochloris sp.]